MASADSALGLDFLTRIVNVQWGGGLAVEFGDHADNAPGTGEDEVPVARAARR